MTYCVIPSWKTRGQSSLTKSASRGAHSPVRGHPRGSKVVPLNAYLFYALILKKLPPMHFVQGIQTFQSKTVVSDNDSNPKVLYVDKSCYKYKTVVLERSFDNTAVMSLIIWNLHLCTLNCQQ